MQIFLFDSLSRKKREFIPLDNDNIRIYACGPTVYDYAHIGNARMAVVTDLLVRTLQTLYKNVTFVSNITDVDDKIIKAANASKKPINEITSKFQKIYEEDMENLGVQKPYKQPKATDHINEMIEMIESLIRNDCAYISEKNVLFNVRKYKFYGCLSRRSKDEQIAGSRVEVANYKKNAEDFILWKPSKDNEPGWNSPWGKGRPGWHIECSAMSKKCLGLPFDIHCGGVDLTFPHHENEIAQSCSSISPNSEPNSFCNYWFHNGFVTASGEKMSKSLGNIKLVNEILKKYDGSIIRFSLLTSHYRQPLDWSEDILKQSKKTLIKFKRIIESSEPIDSANNPKIRKYFDDFLNAIYDDLNTPKALGILNKWFEVIKKSRSTEKQYILASIIKGLEILGVNLTKIKPTLSQVDNTLQSRILKMINERDEARQNKDFKKADIIREKLKNLDIEIEDTVKGTIWRKND